MCNNINNLEELKKKDIKFPNIILPVVKNLPSSAGGPRNVGSIPGSGLLSFLGTVGHVLSLGASSFIEEEHQTWYFLVNTLCLALCHQIYRKCLLGDDCAPQHCPHTGEEFDGVAVALQGKRAGPEGWELSRAPADPSSLEALRGSERWMVLASPWLVLACCRLLRSLNQTGVQWAHRPDLGHWLTR